jgi:hypothetical protein
MRRWILIAFLVLIVLPSLGLAAWVWATLHITYSAGERGGFVQKISRKGWVCKTWEGELAMTTQPGIPPQIFQFSVRDEAVAAQLMRSAGQRVVVSYEQHRGVPGNCFGETEYFITGTRPISSNP